MTALFLLATDPVLTMGQLKCFDSCIVLALLAILTVLSLRERRLLRTEAASVLGLLTAGMFFWGIQRLDELLAPVPARGPTLVLLISDFFIASTFFWSGCILLGLKERIHGQMRPRNEIAASLRDHSLLARVEGLLARTPVRVGVVAFFGAMFLASVALGNRVTELGGLKIDLWDLPTAISSCLGMATLGYGLFREFSREKPELVSRACGAAVVLYGVLQLFRVVNDWVAWIQLFAIVLKVVLIVALSSYHTMVKEMSRVLDAEAEAWQPLAGGALHDVMNELHGTRMRCGFAADLIDSDDAAAARGMIRRIDEQIADTGSTIRGALTQVARSQHGLYRRLVQLTQAVRSASGNDVEVQWQVKGAIEPEVEDGLLAIAKDTCRTVSRKRGRMNVACRTDDRNHLVLELEQDGADEAVVAAAGIPEIDRVQEQLRTRGFRFERGAGRVLVEVQRWRGS
ncbi:MAG: hypothetical protein U1E73_01995 [Planctomycetota bacterium]